MTDSRGDWIHVTRFTFPCVLGIFDWEQREAQALEVELHLGLDLDGAAGGDLTRSVNYAATIEQVEFIAREGRWRLLESMSSAIARHLLARPLPIEGRAQITEVIVRLAKPEVFKGRAVPSVEIHRTLAWAHAPATTIRGAALTILQETRETGAYRIHLDPGRSWTLPASLTTHVVAGTVNDGRESIPAGRAIASAASTVLTAAEQGAVLLGVSRPALSNEN